MCSVEQPTIYSADPKSVLFNYLREIIMVRVQAYFEAIFGSNEGHFESFFYQRSDLRLFRGHPQVVIWSTSVIFGHPYIKIESF